MHIVAVSGEPSFTLKEVKENDATKHLLDVIADELVFAAKRCFMLRIWVVHHTFNPLGAILDITLAGYELNKIGIEVAIAVEELVSEGFYREGFLEVGIRLWTVSKSFKSFHGCSAAVVLPKTYV